MLRRLLLAGFFAVGSVCVDPGFVGAALPATHPYIKWPDPIHSHASTPWTVSGLCKAYNFPTKLSGGGVIGILEFGGGWVQPDLDKFSQLNGLPKIQVTNVSVDGTQNNPGVNLNDDAEVALDIQVVAATYYYATGAMPTIKVFFSNGDFINTINAAVNANCSVLSISWGADEQTWQTQAPGYAAQVEATAQAAAAKGLAIFAASGDYSASDGTSGIYVDLPAACPHIVGCGGTSKTSSSEVVWGDGKSTDYGTGGGYSTVFPVQSFQVGAPPPPKPGLGRMVPDVAADADPNTGYLIVLRGSQVQIGGTSAVAPLYSGLFAAFGSKLGFVTPTLWKNPKAFADITQGSNGAYSAAVGPDPCTGLGAPIGSSLAALFPTAPPPSNVVAINYNTSSRTLSINGDSAANALTITRSGSQLTLQGTGGTRVTVAINSGTPTPPATGYILSGVSGNLTLTGNLQDGNDSLTLNSLAITSISLALGNGNDAAYLNYCNVVTCVIDGGAGTDVFVSVGSTISKNQNRNFP